MACRYTDQRELLPSHTVARYCRKRDIAEDGIPMEGAFRLRENERYLSTNWLEYFHRADRSFQIACVIQSLSAKGRTVVNSASFAMLNVGAAIVVCKSRLGLDLQFVTLGEPDDPSHTGIYGYIEHNAKAATVLAKSVDPNEVYPVGG